MTATEATEYLQWKAIKRLQRPQTPLHPLRTEEGKWAKVTRKRQMYWQITLKMSLSRMLLRCQEKKNGKSYMPSQLLSDW
jgi:hypothetical protein